MPMPKLIEKYNTSNESKKVSITSAKYFSKEVEKDTIIPNPNFRREHDEISNRIPLAYFVFSYDMVCRGPRISLDNLNPPENISMMKEFHE